MNVDAVHVTRFIGLASVGNASKQVCFDQGYYYSHRLGVIVNPHFRVMFFFDWADGQSES